MISLRVEMMHSHLLRKARSSINNRPTYGLKNLCLVKTLVKDVIKRIFF